MDIKGVDALISELLRAVTFIGFVIFYYNLVVAVDAFDLPQRLLSGAGSGWPVFAVYAALFLALATPLGLGGIVVGLFALHFVGELSRAVATMDWANGIVRAVVFFGVLFGTMTFVGVLSVFAALQSQDYLDRVAPNLKDRLDEMVGMAAMPAAISAVLALPLARQDRS